MVICGATGDLTERKLGARALQHAAGRLPAAGVHRRRLRAPRPERRGVPRPPARRRSTSTAATGRRSRRSGSRFARGIEYHRGDFDDPAAYAELAKRLDRIDRDRGTAGNRLFYLAVPPSAVSRDRQPARAGRAGGQRGAAAEAARSAAGRGSSSRSRSATTSHSARTLNREIAEVFDEDQVYRIDHYLGKETVQNLAVFRFGNGLFEPIWNRRYIDSVQITVAETVGVEGRGEFYDDTGALRDIVQNHGLQLMAMFAMEPPVEFDAEDLRDEKLKVLRAVKPMSPAEVAANIGPRPVRRRAGSRASASPRTATSPRSRPTRETETFVALKLAIDSWRWAGVPFYIRTGKALPEPRDGDRGPVPPRAAGALRARRRAADRPERARHPRPARRGHPPALRRQGPRPGAPDPHRQHGLPLRLDASRSTRRMPTRRCCSTR